MIKNILFAIKEIKNVSKYIIITLFLLAVFSSFVSVADLFLIKFVIDYAVSELGNFRILVIYLLCYFVITFLLYLCKDYVIARYVNKFEVKLKSRVVPRIYQKCLEINLLEFHKKDFYDKLNRAIDEAENRYYMVCIQLLTLLMNIIAFCAVFIVYHDVYIISAVLINVIVYMLYYVRTKKKNYQFEKSEETVSRFEDYLNRIFSEREYASELRILAGSDKILRNKYNRYRDGYGTRFADYIHCFWRESTLTSTLSYVIYWISGIYISALLFDVKISAGDFVLLVHIVSSMSVKLIDFFQVLPDLYQSSLYISDIREILKYPADFDNDESAESVSEFVSLAFHNVFFQYNEGDDFSLHHLSFTIQKGEIIALAGLNGSGKSTVIDCIIGMIQPDAGCIYLNGKPYSDYKMSDIRKLFSVVFQDFHIYEVSVAENVLMRKVQSKEDSLLVDEALTYAGMQEKTASLPDGKDTIVSLDDNACFFSTGEMQMLAIARAYARKAPVILFDEPTSALDVSMTDAFYSKLFKLRDQQGKTILFTSHKMTYVHRADKILLMDHGTIVENGKKAECS